MKIAMTNVLNNMELNKILEDFYAIRKTGKIASLIAFVLYFYMYVIDQ